MVEGLLSTGPTRSFLVYNFSLVMPFNLWSQVHVYIPIEKLIFVVVYWFTIINEQYLIFFFKYRLPLRVAVSPQCLSSHNVLGGSVVVSLES